MGQCQSVKVSRGVVVNKRRRSERLLLNDIDDPYDGGLRDEGKSLNISNTEETSTYTESFDVKARYIIGQDDDQRDDTLSKEQDETESREDNQMALWNNVDKQFDDHSFNRNFSNTTSDDPALIDLIPYVPSINVKKQIKSKYNRHGWESDDNSKDGNVSDFSEESSFFRSPTTDHNIIGWDDNTDDSDNKETTPDTRKLGSRQFAPEDSRALSPVNERPMAQKPGIGKTLAGKTLDLENKIASDRDTDESTSSDDSSEGSTSSEDSDDNDSTSTSASTLSIVLNDEAYIERETSNSNDDHPPNVSTPTTKPTEESKNEITSVNSRALIVSPHDKGYHGAMDLNFEPIALSQERNDGPASEISNQADKSHKIDNLPTPPSGPPSKAEMETRRTSMTHEHELKRTATPPPALFMPEVKTRPTKIASPPNKQNDKSDYGLEQMYLSPPSSFEEIDDASDEDIEMNADDSRSDIGKCKLPTTRSSITYDSFANVMRRRRSKTEAVKENESSTNSKIEEMSEESLQSQDSHYIDTNGNMKNYSGNSRTDFHRRNNYMNPLQRSLRRESMETNNKTTESSLDDPIAGKSENLKVTEPKVRDTKSVGVENFENNLPSNSTKRSEQKTIGSDPKPIQKSLRSISANDESNRPSLSLDESDSTQTNSQHNLVETNLEQKDQSNQESSSAQTQTSDDNDLDKPHTASALKNHLSNKPLRPVHTYERQVDETPLNVSTMCSSPKSKRASGMLSNRPDTSQRLRRFRGRKSMEVETEPSKESNSIFDERFKGKGLEKGSSLNSQTISNGAETIPILETKIQENGTQVSLSKTMEQSEIQSDNCHNIVSSHTTTTEIEEKEVDDQVGFRKVLSRNQNEDCSSAEQRIDRGSISRKIHTKKHPETPNNYSCNDSTGSRGGMDNGASSQVKESSLHRRSASPISFRRRRNRSPSPCGISVQSSLQEKQNNNLVQNSVSNVPMQEDLQRNRTSSPSTFRRRRTASPSPYRRSMQSSASRDQNNESSQVSVSSKADEMIQKLKQQKKMAEDKLAEGNSAKDAISKMNRGTTGNAHLIKSDQQEKQRITMQNSPCNDPKKEELTRNRSTMSSPFRRYNSGSSPSPYQRSTQASSYVDYDDESSRLSVSSKSDEMIQKLKLQKKMAEDKLAKGNNQVQETVVAMNIECNGNRSDDAKKSDSGSIGIHRLHRKKEVGSQFEKDDSKSNNNQETTIDSSVSVKAEEMISRLKSISSNNSLSSSRATSPAPSRGTSPGPSLRRSRIVRNGTTNVAISKSFESCGDSSFVPNSETAFAQDSNSSSNAIRSFNHIPVTRNNDSSGTTSSDISRSSSDLQRRRPPSPMRRQRIQRLMQE